MKKKMLPLDKDLQSAKGNLLEFHDITIRVLQYLPNVLTNSEEKSGYLIFSSKIAGTTKYIRPINKVLFINEPKEFENCFGTLIDTLQKIKQHQNICDDEKVLIDRTIYTIQQSIGIGLDLLVNQNSARKHVGNRFEELVKSIFTEIGVANKKQVLQIPYETDEGTKTYKCENDLIISPYDKVKSTSKQLDEKEVVVSVKTTSKDRMGKMFIDKILLEKFVQHDQKVIGIFLNDVQRKEADNISFTLVAGLFMVYTNFLTKLEGIYYLDPPPNANKKPFSDHMKPFSELITRDLERLLTP
ncbi:MAG: hypothetical protein WCR29_05205 [Bacteroidales bacterium]